MNVYLRLFIFSLLVITPFIAWSQEKELKINTARDHQRHAREAELITHPTASGQIIWPDGKKAAIILTYDDGLDSHLQIAIPQLDSFEFKGSFYLYSHLPEDRFAAWKEVSDHGHELGNHSLFHPCEGNTAASRASRSSSLNYDVPSIIREISVMNKLLFAITGKQPESYAYPCSETMVGGKDYADSLRTSGLVKNARTVGNRPVITDFENLDFFKIPSFAPPPACSSEILIGYAEDVLDQEGLGVYIFHGVGGDYLSAGASEHMELLRYLDAHRDEIWVATFTEVAGYIQNFLNR